MSGRFVGERNWTTLVERRDTVREPLRQLAQHLRMSPHFHLARPTKYTSSVCLMGLNNVRTLHFHFLLLFLFFFFLVPV